MGRVRPARQARAHLSDVSAQAGSAAASVEVEPVAPIVVGVRPSRRRFSPGDVLRLLVGVGIALLGLFVALVGRSTANGLEADIARLLARVPKRVVDGMLALAQMLATLVPLVAVVVLLVRRRFALVAQVAGAAAVAFAATVGIDAGLEERRLGQVLDALASAHGMFSGAFPSSAYLAAATATVCTAAPWMSRRWRRAAWTGIALLAVVRLLTIVVPTGDLLLAVGVGAVVGSVTLLLFGAPNPEPSPAELVAALRRAGIEPERVERSGERAGHPSYHVLDRTGRWSFVKLRMPEDRDADFLSRVYRAARFRTAHLSSPFASLRRQVEHEVFLLDLSSRAGVRVPTVVGFGVTPGESAFLAEELIDGQPISDAALARPAVLTDAWRQLARLHGGDIAHRRITSGNLLVDADDAVWLVDFDDAEAAADQLELDRDVADLLVQSALAAGVGPSVRAAVDALGSEAVLAALPLLQPLALSSSVRRRLRQDKELLPGLRQAVQRATGATDVHLARLERIRPRTLVIIVGSTVAFYTLLPQLGNLGGTAEALRHANPLWLAGLLLASAATYVFATVSFLGSVPRELPVPATFRAQVASSFATLLGPGSSGSLALGVRFLERTGVGTAESTAAVALNAGAGTVVHVLLLLGFVVWTGKSGVQRFSLPDTNVVLLVIAVLATLVGVALLVRPLRQRVLVPVLEALRAGVAQIGRVFRSPARVIALFGGSAALSLAYIASLMAAVMAFGGGLTFPQVGTAYLAGSAIASLAPTPGGLGAVESALIAALTGYGLSDGIAVSSVLTFRLATFWLPILPGWVLLGWMQRHGEL
jgi:uncharacterized membrane protein YbhN (UPF0104 family)/tRNA A-37 threonylcarbamoyl transferase component Bud32